MCRGVLQDVVGLLIKLRDAGYAEFVTGKTRFGLLERTRVKVRDASSSAAAPAR
jgi:hypothetical protein